MREHADKLLNEDDDTVSLKEFILGIKSWWRFILSKFIIISFFMLIGGLAGFMYSYISKPYFTATTTFVLEEGDNGKAIGSFGGLASMVGIDMGNGGGLFTGDNIIELYKSRTMVEQALLSRSSTYPKMLMVDWFINSNQLKENWKTVRWNTIDFNNGGPNVKKDSVLREIVKVINKEYLTVSKPDKKLSKIQVNVKSTDELFAKEFSGQIVNAVNNFYIQTKTMKSVKNVKILQHKVDSVRNVMNGAIYSAVAITDATPNLNPTRQIQRIAPSQRAQFSAEANKAVLGEMVKNLEISKMALLKETPLIQIIDSPILPLEKTQVGRIKSILFGAIIFGFVLGIILTFNYTLKKIMQ